jgi:hypothetical protein
MKNPCLIFFLILAILCSLVSVGVCGVVQVDADLPGVALFLDGSYIGDTPKTLSDLLPGEYTLAATLPGHPPAEKKITVSQSDKDSVFFSFGEPYHEKGIGIIKIHDCVGTPEQTGLRGTSISIVTPSEYSMMAYYTGSREGVQCAGSEDGKRWYEFPYGCLQTSGIQEKSLFPISRPWVFESEDGGFRMLYLASDNAHPSLFHAFSQNGVDFSPEGKVTFLNHEITSSSWEQYSMVTGIRLLDGKIRMYYSDPYGGIRSAVSIDGGKAWTVEDGHRIVDGTNPSVILLPDGKFCLFYVDLSSGPKGQKLMATISEDGLTFSPNKRIPIISSEEKGVWILDPEIHISGNESLDLYYSIMGKSTEIGIELPAIMHSVIDIDCLVDRLSDN